MDVVPQTLIDLNRQFNFDFQQVFQSQPKLWDKKARRVNLKAFEGVYAFRGQIPEMRKWVGDRIVRHFVARSYVLPNEPWELTVDVDRRAIEFDQISLYDQDWRNLGEAGGSWYDKMLTDVQIANPLAFDGQNFYDTDHPVSLENPSMGVYVNSFTTRPLNADNLWFLISTMMGYTDDVGRSLGLFPTVLEVPTTLARDAIDAIKQLRFVQRVKNAAGNDFVAAVALDNAPPLPFPDPVPVVNPRLTDQNFYYLHSTNRFMPFIVQVAKDPTQVISFTNPNDPSVFWQRKFVWGIDADGAAGVTLPFLSIRAKVGA
jgi:phage major head subunit gpT-like protein